jgi:peptidoglycan/xylan/chitin deacetylase (PgdA/CDA1 family)
LQELTVVLSWGHPYLTSLDYPAIVAQMTQLEDAFMQVLGFYPAYMRPPFLAFNGVVLSAMGDLGYHVISASIDTKDYENDHPDLISHSFEKFRAELDAGGSIILSHDVHEQTVHTLTRAMLEEICARGLQSMCLLTV